MALTTNRPHVFATLIIAGLLASAGAQASDFMRAAGRTAQPIGHFEFCQRMPGECGPTYSSSPIRLTKAAFTLISQVNAEVNRSIIPITDQELWGVQEFWSFPGTHGDCEDYVLEKRRRLIAAGIPAGALLVTVVRQTNGEGHAVLTVTTDRGDLILDNVHDKLLPWTATDYEFLKRQSKHHAGHWVDINNGRPIAVGSVSATR